MSRAAVLLIDPKYPHNVGAALRACAIFGAERLGWTGERMPPSAEWPEGARLPREERMKAYRRVFFGHAADPVAALLAHACDGYVPVCVERTRNAERLPYFVHPERALYVFGPEDGHVPGAVREACHRFVTIPTALDGDPDESPLNLAAAVNVVLYDRLVTASVPCGRCGLPLSGAAGGRAGGYAHGPGFCPDRR